MDLNEEKSDEKLFDKLNSNDASNKVFLSESFNNDKSLESFKNKKIGKITKSFLENKSNNESNTNNNQSPFHTPVASFKPFPKSLLLDNLEFKLENDSKKLTENIKFTNNNVPADEGVKEKICEDNIYFINSFEEKNNLKNNAILNGIQNTQMELAIFVVLYISDDFLRKKFSQFIIGNTSNTSTKTTYNDSIIGKDFKETIIIKEKFIVKVCDTFKNLIHLFIQRFNLKLLEYGLKLLEIEEIEELKKLTGRDLAYSIKNLKRSMKPDIDLPSFDQSTEIGVFKIDNYSLVYSPDLLIMINSKIPKLSFVEEINKLPVTKSQVYSEDSSSSNSFSDDSNSNFKDDNKLLKERRKIKENEHYTHEKYEIDNLKANDKNLEDSGITLKLNNSSSTNKLINSQKDPTPIKDANLMTNNSNKKDYLVKSSDKKSYNNQTKADDNRIINKKLVFDESKDSMKENSKIKNISQNESCCNKCVIF